jgi:prephenate dehydrogenase
MIKHITIIGIGYTGVSLGLALKKNIPGIFITGVDRGAAIIRAKNIGAIDNGCIFDEAAECLRETDLLFFTSPVNITKELFPTVVKNLKDNSIVTDTGFTKREITTQARSFLGEKAVFIGGHPIIGYKRGAIEEADPFLFSNNTYVLTREKDTPQKALDTLKSVLASIGAHIIVLDPEEHDKLNSGINHILQLIAIAHVNSMCSHLDEDTFGKVGALASSRFKKFSDALRTPSWVWEDIFRSNIKYVKKNIGLFIENLKKLADSLESPVFTEEYEKAVACIRKIPPATKGFEKSLFHIFVTVKDAPGAIAELTALLSSGGYNLRDIGVEKIVEGEAATVRLSFDKQSTASKVGSMLVKSGFNCRTQFEYEDFYL